MKRKSILLAAVAVLLVLGLRVSPIWSYFTDSSYANGGLPITVEPTTTVRERYGQQYKFVQITNTGKNPVYVRARVYSSLPTNVTASAWSEGTGGWYYYGSEENPTILNPSESTGSLDPEHIDDLLGDENLFKVWIDFPKPEEATDGMSYNVIVVYESVPVQYDEDGSPYADWNFTLDRKTSEGGQ